MLVNVIFLISFDNIIWLALYFLSSLRKTSIFSCQRSLLMSRDVIRDCIPALLNFLYLKQVPRDYSFSSCLDTCKVNCWKFGSSLILKTKTRPPPPRCIITICCIRYCSCCSYIFQLADILVTWCWLNNYGLKIDPREWRNYQFMI